MPCEFGFVGVRDVEDFDCALVPAGVGHEEGRMIFVMVKGSAERMKVV